MADKRKKKRTILASADPSEENWQPSWGTRVARHLRKKSKISIPAIKYTPTPRDQFRAGLVKQARRPRGRTVTQGSFGERRRWRGRRHFGISYRRKF